ncbi:MAG TPA: type II toxin-antitoxin system VapC family toxin [Mycobacteriales bacterium]|nr:type II toxin-antitoxin system VapC family toxin [Mycobacteriales bacterium]
MPTRSSRPPELLVDTSVAVCLVWADHDQHAVTTRALRGRSLGLSGHAAFETFSVLSRLPAPARRSPAVLSRLLAQSFPASRFLSAEGHATLLASLPDKGVAGGQVYDALVAAAAVEHDMVLATRDRRALDTYRALGVQVEVIEG